MATSARRVYRMSGEFAARLRSEFSEYTRAEKAVASYLLANISRLPFETAATIAEAVGVSQMTVGRFLRARGYTGLSDLKRELRAEFSASPVLISDRVARLTKSEGGDRLRTSFEAEIEALLGVYELVETPVWRRVVDHLTSAERVCLAGFQTVEGLASVFTQRLSYLRPGAKLLDGRDGTFADLFEKCDPAGGGAFLFLIEMRRCTRAARLLAEEASARGIPVAVLCDGHCGWAHDVADMVLSVSTDSNLFWDSQTPFSSALSLLLDETARRLGPDVVARTQHLAKLQDHFGAFE